MALLNDPHDANWCQYAVNVLSDVRVHKNMFNDTKNFNF